jgi:hypothetical protein
MRFRVVRVRPWSERDQAWWSLCASTRTFPVSIRDSAMWLRLHCLSQAEVGELIAACHQRKPIKELAQRHGSLIHSRCSTRPASAG